MGKSSSVRSSTGLGHGTAEGCHQHVQVDAGYDSASQEHQVKKIFCLRSQYTNKPANKVIEVF
jgi:hypothetical protein